MLNIEKLQSPYNIIAADVNNSKSVTTFDIAELRKLILGIYTELPNCPSWKYLPQFHTFTFPDNPWYPTGTLFPEVIDYPNANGYDFFAVKIGDVNDTALPTASREQPSQKEVFSWPEIALQKNQVINIPILYVGNEPLEAYQFGLKFDAKKLDFVGVSQGDLQGVDSGSFGLTRINDGEIRTLWFVPDYSNPEPYLKQGTVLFYLTFKVLENVREAGLPLKFDDNVLPSLAWSPDSQVFRVAKSETTFERQVPERKPSSKVVCSPNPTTGTVKFTLSNQEKQTARLVLMDAFGSVLWMRTIGLDANEQVFDVDVLTSKPAGVYLWKLWSPDGEMQTGHVVKH